MLILNGYRPPAGDQTSFLEILEKGISAIDLSKFDIFLMGDFNIDLDDRFNANTKLFGSQMKSLGFFSVKPITKAWLTDELSEEIKDKDEALHQAERTKREDHWVEARRLRNLCLRNIRMAKVDFIKDQIAEKKHDSKKFWNSINSLLPGNNNKSKNDIYLRDENNMEVSRENTAEYMNAYFATIGPNLVEQFPTVMAPDDVDIGDSVTQFVTSDQVVLKIVREINICKFSAIHNLSSRVMKDAFSLMTDRLTTIFNASFSMGKVPDSWKHATVIPLHKGGNSNDVKNFRPVSLLPIQGKLIEKIVHSRIKTWPDANSFLDKKSGWF